MKCVELNYDDNIRT